MFNYKVVLFVFASLVCFSCKKSWMEEKSDKSIGVPTSLSDFQSLLDYKGVMYDVRPALGEESADDYYLSNTMYTGLIAADKNIYVWEKEIYVDKDIDGNWNNCYKQVFQANIVLEGVNDVAAEDIGTPAWNNVKGSAHFFRADAFFNVAQIFAKPYSLTLPDEPGIPLRLNADVKVKSIRAGLQETYQQILTDLHTAVGYLPVVPLHKTRPSKPAAYALLSRVYMSMQDYSHAFLYADSCLKLYDSLLDYNTINTTPTYTIAALNKEVILHSTMMNYFQARSVIVDTNLYKSYKVNDLRQKVFFKTNTNGGMRFVGAYTNGITGNPYFTGIATDEVFLTRAECYARAGNITAAMKDLNTLMIKRWKTGAFVPFTASTTSEALALILDERRKETIFRGLRWADLRRLNSGGANIVLTRVVNGQTYTLPANSPRYALPLPPEVINLSEMPQNER